MSAPLKQTVRVATDLGALVDTLRAAMRAETLANQNWGGPDDDSDILAADARCIAEDNLRAGLMALGVSPFDARQMVLAIGEPARSLVEG